MNDDLEKYECVSARVDGENATSEEATSVVDDDDALMTVYRQYQEIGRLMRAVPAPTPSRHFADQTLARLSRQNKRNTGRGALVFAIAAMLLVALPAALWFVTITPQPSDSPQTFTGGEVESSVALDTTEDAFWALMPDAHPYSDLEQTMMLLEEVSLEQVLLALEEITLEAHQQEETALLYPMQEYGWQINGLAETPGMYSEMFLMLETLNDAETRTLNDFLRAALAQT